MPETGYRLPHCLAIILVTTLAISLPLIEAITDDCRDALDQACALEDQGQLQEVAVILEASPARIQSSQAGGDR